MILFFFCSLEAAAGRFNYPIPCTMRDPRLDKKRLSDLTLLQVCVVIVLLCCLKLLLLLLHAAPFASRT